MAETLQITKKYISSPEQEQGKIFPEIYAQHKPEGSLSLYKDMFRAQGTFLCDCAWVKRG